MIQIKHGENIYDVKNLTTELLVKEFEEITYILNNKKLHTIERWSRVFKYLGVPEETIDNFDTTDFIELIKEYNLTTVLDTTITKEIEIDGWVYSAYDEKFKLTVRETALIENYIHKNDNKYIGELLAIVYKKQGIESSLHFDTSHIAYKAKLIRENITADVAIPLINFLSKRLIKDFDIIENEVNNG